MPVQFKSGPFIVTKNLTKYIELTINYENDTFYCLIDYIRGELFDISEFYELINENTFQMGTLVRISILLCKSRSHYIHFDYPYGMRNIFFYIKN